MAKKDEETQKDAGQGEVTEPTEIAAEEREQAVAEEPVAEAPAEDAAPPAEDAAPAAEAPAAEDEGDDEPETPRVKPEIPGMDLEPDIVLESDKVLGSDEDPYAEDGEAAASDEDEEPAPQPIASAAISLAAGARYTATGRRKTAVARVILKPGTGEYSINGRTLEVHLPRLTLQRQVRQALETVGLEEKMDVVASIHGGGITAQSGALRHGISRALVDADPNLRSELKRRGFLTRDARVKERKKAGLKKARKRPQFSKR